MTGLNKVTTTTTTTDLNEIRKTKMTLLLMIEQLDVQENQIARQQRSVAPQMRNAFQDNQDNAFYRQWRPKYPTGDEYFYGRGGCCPCCPCEQEGKPEYKAPLERSPKYPSTWEEALERLKELGFPVDRPEYPYDPYRPQPPARTLPGLPYEPQPPARTLPDYPESGEGVVPPSQRIPGVIYQDGSFRENNLKEDRGNDTLVQTGIRNKKNYANIGDGENTVYQTGYYNVNYAIGGKDSDTVIQEGFGNILNMVETHGGNDHVESGGSLNSSIIETGEGNDSVYVKGDNNTANIKDSQGNDMYQVEGKNNKVTIEDDCGNNTLALTGPVKDWTKSTENGSTVYKDKNGNVVILKGKADVKFVEETQSGGKAENPSSGGKAETPCDKKDCKDTKCKEHGKPDEHKPGNPDNSYNTKTYQGKCSQDAYTANEPGKIGNGKNLAYQEGDRNTNIFHGGTGADYMTQQGSHNKKNDAHLKDGLNKATQRGDHNWNRVVGGKDKDAVNQSGNNNINITETRAGNDEITSGGMYNNSSIDAGEDNDYIWMGGAFNVIRAKGGAGDDVYRVRGRNNKIKIKDDEGSNKLLLEGSGWKSTTEGEYTVWRDNNGNEVRVKGKVAAHIVVPG